MKYLKLFPMFFIINLIFCCFIYDVTGDDSSTAFKEDFESGIGGWGRFAGDIKVSKTQSFIKNTGSHALKLTGEITGSGGYAAAFIHVLNISVTPGTEFSFAYYFGLKKISYIGYLLHFNSGKTGAYYSYFIGNFINTSTHYAFFYTESSFKWHKHTSDIYENYQKAFGSVPSDLKITRISCILGDPYFLGRTQTAYFDSIRITQKKMNNPPSQPMSAIGETFGMVNRTYQYSTSATDEDSEKVRFYFDKGDDSGLWTDWVKPGEKAFIDLSWSKEGEYIIKVFTQDISGKNSSWSEPLTVYIIDEKKSLDIIDPNGNELLRVKTPVPIYWSFNEKIGKFVRLDLFKGEEYVLNIISNTSNDGNYSSWIIPEDLSLDSDYRIKISSINKPEITDFSDGYLSIVEYVDPTTVPDLFVYSEDIIFSKNPPLIGDILTIYAPIYNAGNQDSSATIKFFSNELTENISNAKELIDTVTIIVNKHDKEICMAKWKPGGKGDYIISVEIVSSKPNELNMENNIASTILTIGEIVPYISLGSLPDIVKIKEGYNKTIKLDVYSYNISLENVSLKIIDSDNLNVNIHTHTQNIIKNGNLQFIIEVSGSDLPSNIKSVQKEILLQATGFINETIWSSNGGYLEIQVYRPGSPIEEITLASVIVGALITFFGSLITESGKYRLFSLVGLIPFLYTRIHRDEVLENFVRGQIYGYIKTNPGSHYNHIRKKLGVGNGTLAHHLNILEKTGLIKSRREGFRYRLFYPTAMKFPEMKKYMLSELQIELLKIIEENDGITQKEIVVLRDEKQQTISYNLKELEKVREITTIKKHGKKHYYITKKDDNT